MLLARDKAFQLQAASVQYLSPAGWPSRLQVTRSLPLPCQGTLAKCLHLSGPSSPGHEAQGTASAWRAVTKMLQVRATCYDVQPEPWLAMPTQNGVHGPAGTAAGHQNGASLPRTRFQPRPTEVFRLLTPVVVNGSWAPKDLGGSGPWVGMLVASPFETYQPGSPAFPLPWGCDTTDPAVETQVSKGESAA